MSKFFNVVSNKKNQNNNGYNNYDNMNSSNNGRVQGYITPSNYNNQPNYNNNQSSYNNQPNYNNQNQNADTFVYGSYNASNQNNFNNRQNGNINNINGNMNNNYVGPQNYNNGNLQPNSGQRMISPSINKSNEQKVMKPSFGVENKNKVEEMEVLDTLTIEEEKESKSSPLDPLNNANNPIPVNPVAEPEEIFEEEELPKDVKANIFSVIGMMFGMIFTPGTTIVSNSKKYRSTFKSFMVTVWITAVSLVLCIGVRILIGSFTKSYNAVTGASHIYFNFANIFSLDNYIQYLIIAFLISFVGIFVVALTYYASSFLNSKGVPLGSYLMVSNLAMLPLIIGVVAVGPAIGIISRYLSLLAVIFCFLYTLIAFLIGINEILKFKNINRKILYNVLNLSCIILVAIVIYVLLVRTNILVAVELNL